MLSHTPYPNTIYLTTLSLSYTQSEVSSPLSLCTLFFPAMAIKQKIAAAEHDDESQGSTLHDNSSNSTDEGSSSCSEYAAAQHGDLGMIMKRTRRKGRSRATRPHVAPPSLRASPTCRKNTRRARRSRTSTIPNRHAKSNAESTMMMMKRLRSQLHSLWSLLPPAARSSRPCSVIADALRYRKVLEKEIELLLTALSYSQQVDVKRVECGGLQIKISCAKKSGLMVALMETMESFGLQFTSVSVSCQDDNIIIDALSTQENVGKGDALKGMLVANILRFNQS